MRAYEMTFILAPTLEPEALAGEVAAIKKLIAGDGGEVTAEKEWGRRKLAYPIQDHSEGVYHILRFTLGSQGLKELNRYIGLNDERYLRHLIIKDEGTPLEYAPSESDEYGDSRDFRGGRDRDRDRDRPFRGGRDRDDRDDDDDRNDRPPRRDRESREDRAPRRERVHSGAGRED
jgi:small subunit ribosomal protein S6